MASVADNLWLGLLSGAVVGALVAGSLAVLSIRYVVNQIVGGTVINILALGLTSYLTGQFLQKNEALNTPGRFQNIAIRGSRISHSSAPSVRHQHLRVSDGRDRRDHVLGLFYTRWGLRVQSVGEHPTAADTVGIRVLFTRYRNVILGGVVAGIEAYFSLGASVGQFEEGMTAGRGFIGLAAMMFGRWNRSVRSGRP